MQSLCHGNVFVIVIALLEIYSLSIEIEVTVFRRCTISEECIKCHCMNLAEY